MKLKFDIEKYKFREQVEAIFDTKDLSVLHQVLKKEYELLDDVATDQFTDHHKKFYEEIGQTTFYDIYESFIEQEIKPLFNESILYQKIPTFRVHLPNNLGVAAFHRDREYSHSPHENNIFLPMTKAFGTNTIWVETKEDEGDFNPMEARYGEYYVWDGPNLKHGNKKNSTNETRVSIDFRTLAISKYEDTGLISTSINTPMTIGKYWNK